MPLTGEYAPSTSEWARKQAEAFEASNGAEANTLRGMPIILLTSVGAKSGKLRKTALMRVEHDGEDLAVASLGGAPEQAPGTPEDHVAAVNELMSQGIRIKEAVAAVAEDVRVSKRELYSAVLAAR